MAIKYELDTIPVIDAFKADSECPFCLLYHRSEQKYLEFHLGNSVMIPEQRELVNEHGFCSDHFTMMLETRKAPHGLGLMAHTHLWETNKKLFSFIDDLNKSLDKPKNRDKSIDNLKKFLSNHIDSCLICEKIEAHMLRYAYTTVSLWKKQEDFKNLFGASRGFCLKHIPLLLDMALQWLSADETVSFFNALLPNLKKNYKRLEEEILWYTQKFDYQNTDKPWGTSKDALERTIMKLEGTWVEKS
jgi:hypothetical protein